VPATAVIPAPIANINVVAVKKLVVEFLAGQRRYTDLRLGHPPMKACGPSLAPVLNWELYFEKIRVFQAGFRLNTTAWNNGICLKLLLGSLFEK
jgi:hypothetical protein